jgi:5-methylcytosine-specific restriction protein A
MPQDQFYSSAAWKQTRSGFIRANPTCCVAGCGKPTKHVDHAVSRRAGGAAHDSRNLKPYCHSHHSQKTARRDGGFGHAPSNKRVAMVGCDANGNPTDPGHHWVALGAGV